MIEKGRLTVHLGRPAATTQHPEFGFVLVAADATRLKAVEH